MKEVGDEAAQRAYEERSWHELEAGRLPLRAQERLAAMEADHAFTSDLTAREHLAVRGVGFEPVGQVMGASVFQIGYTGGWDCGVSGYGLRGGGYGQRGYGPGGYGGPGGPGGPGGYGPGRGGRMPGGTIFNGGGFSGQGMGGYGYNQAYLTVETVTVTPWKRSLQQAQQLAMGRLEQEARALGGDGVVAVRFSENRLPNGAIEFLVIGTAVRGPQPKRSTTIFSSALSGQDFARLLHAGWMPVRLLFGLACMTRHDDLATRWNNQSWSNVELAGYTQLVLDTRAEARLQLAREAASAGAEAAVLEDTYESVTEHECYLIEGGHDHVVRTTFVGTGLTRVPRTGKAPPAAPPALAMLRLSDRPARRSQSDRQERMP